VDAAYPCPSTLLSGSFALALQIMWRYGELVETGTSLDDFLDTLYRFMGWPADPPGEFDGFMTERDDQKSFWGLEIRVGSEKHDR